MNALYRAAYLLIPLAVATGVFLWVDHCIAAMQPIVGSR